MRHLLNGIEISPRNRDSIGVVSDFTGDPEILSLNVDSIILPREANEYIKNWIQTNGLFIGIPYTVEMEGNISLEYYIDLCDPSAKPILRQHEIEVKIKRKNGSDDFWEKARGTSFDLMVKQKGVNYFDYKDVGYYVIRDSAETDALQMAIALFMITLQLIQATKDLADRAAEIATTPIQGTLKFAIQLLYWISLVTALITMMAQIFPILFPRIKYLKGLYYSEIFKKGCEFLGYTALDSSIFTNQPGWFTLPIPLQSTNESFFEKISNDLPDYFNTGHCSASDTTPTFGAWLDEVTKQFNAKLFIDPSNKTVRLERRDWQQNQTNLILDPALNIQPERDEQFTYNTEDAWKRYYISYTLDYSDTHTVDGDMFGWHQAEYSTENALTLIDPDLLTIKGLNEVRINFAMGDVKGKLGLLEFLAIPFAVAIDVITNVITFGLGGTNYFAQILDRVNALKISNEYFGITKCLYVKKAPGSNKRVTADWNKFPSVYSATGLWNNFHYINFIDNNDFIIHEEARVRIRQSQFVSLQNSNYIFTNNQWCEVLRLEWIDEKNYASITYKEPNNWASGKVTLLKIN
jgi:hypothetical protein